MSKELSQVEFYFPQGDYKDKSELASTTVNYMKEAGSIEYCGYIDEGDLLDGLIHNLGSGPVTKVVLSDEQKGTIEKIITSTIEKCNKQLSVPTKNFVFVHPFFSGEEDRVFEGVMAVATFSCVFHLFIDVGSFTTESLENTVAHEFNHTVYQYHHYNDIGNYTLLDNILMEGLAENFRESFFKPEETAWAWALTEDKAFSVLTEIDSKILASTDEEAIRSFMFGNETFGKWTGYSVGYWLVKRFIAQNKHLSWEEIMKTSREKFLTALK